MLPKRTILMAALGLHLSLAPAYSQTETSRQKLTFYVAGEEIMVESFGPCVTNACPKVLILSGSKGFRSYAYDALAKTFRGAGLTPYLVHYLSENDLAKISETGTAKQRKAFYTQRRPKWISLVQGVTAQLSRSQNSTGKIGILGISLGAQVASVVVTHSSAFSALTLVDGSFPEGFPPPSNSLPPLQILWGSSDKTFSLSTGESLQRLATQLGGQAELNVFLGGEHDFFLKERTQNATQAYEKAANFFVSTLK